MGDAPPWRPACLHGYSQEETSFMETHEAPQSLWNLIVEHVPESELPEIRGFLGDALIDMYTETLAEVEVWQHIWREVKQGGPSRAQTPCPALADPPAVRELLRAQVQLLLLSVRERAAREGRDGDAVMSRYKPAVVNYALATPSNRSDGVGPPSRSAPRQNTLVQINLYFTLPYPTVLYFTLPNCTLLYPTQLSSSRSSLSSSCQEEIETMRSQLNVSSIDQAVSHLQAVLTQEWELLKTHVQTLQERVEQEHRTQVMAVAPEPTVTELREQRRVLQMDLERPCLLPTCPPSTQDPGPAQSHRLTGKRGLYVGDRKTQSTLTSTVTSGPNTPPHIRPHRPPAPPRTEPPPMRRTRTQSTSSSSSPSTRNVSPLQPFDHQTNPGPESTRSPHRTPIHPSAAVCRGEVVSSPITSHPCSSPTTPDLSPLLPASLHRLASKGRETTGPSSSLQLAEHHRTTGPITDTAPLSDGESSLWHRSPKQDSETVFSPKVRRPRALCSPDYLQTPRQASATTQPSSRGAAGSPGSCLPPLLPSGYLVTESAPFLPSPPAVQRPPSRGQSVARRLCVPQGDSLVSPT
ncbi:coiled-coil domain-containing protein 24 [Osmerus eperlanus]|uniref:coiled-coil domain-containing protein 24 n=1 Tax=Osmerus eperlanus TaxID=29151 RepID=UPI002E158C15